MTSSTTTMPLSTLRRVLALAAMAAMALAALLLPAGGARAAVRGAHDSPDTVRPAVVLMTGEAYGLSATGLVPIPKTPHAGPVSTAGASSSTPCVVALPLGLINADALCAGVVTSPAPATSTATASVADVTIGLPIIPVIKIRAVQSSSVSTCAGATGSSTVASISVGGMAVDIPPNPAPNTTISLLGVTLIINEQTPAAVGTGLTVNAVHVKALGLLDVVVASSASGVSGC